LILEALTEISHSRDRFIFTIFGFLEDIERISKPVFRFVLFKWQLVHNRTHSDAFIVAILSKKEEEEQQRQQTQQTKNSYWQNELDSLGVESKQKKEHNDDKEELENLTEIIKQTMFQDYKTAYSKEADAHKEEVQSTVTVG
jgi:hypothetical protein